MIRSNEVLKILGICKKTLENYEKQGKIKFVKNGRLKYYDKSEIEKLIGIKSNKPDRKIIAYYRVSTNGQKIELANQRSSIETFCINKGIVVDDYLFDIASGLNYNRKNFLKLIDMIENSEVSEIIITYKDRLVRFGYELIEARCKANDVKLTVINMQTTSPEEEMVTDLMSIIHVFSSRLYGLRKYKKEIKESYDKNTQDRDSSEPEDPKRS